jgi:hypothetical protein
MTGRIRRDRCAELFRSAHHSHISPAVTSSRFALEWFMLQDLVSSRLDAGDVRHCCRWNRELGGARGKPLFS